MREMAQTHPTALARMARTLELDVQGKSDYEAALAAANAVSELVARLGLPQRLSEVGISKAEIPKIAGAAGVAEGAAVSQAEKLLKRML
jgi:alcohol dehydrogenase class IV